jgi:hypothetical protein
VTLRDSTIANCNNRRRFVTEAAAFPYKRHRERQNAKRAVRKTLHKLEEALHHASRHGTHNSVSLAIRIQVLANLLAAQTQELQKFPTVAEIKAMAARQKRRAQRWGQVVSKSGLLAAD